MQAQTLASKQVWQSSDGQRTIWEVNIKADDGKEYKLQTYSAEIAKKGFAGEVESYVSPRGDRFVRQPKKEGDYKGGKGRPNNQPIIQAQWAIGRAATIIQQRGEILPDDEYWVEVEKYAVKLIEVANRIVGGSEGTDPKVTDTVFIPPDDIEDGAAIGRYMTATLAETEA